MNDHMKSTYLNNNSLVKDKYTISPGEVDYYKELQFKIYWAKLESSLHLSSAIKNDK